MCFSPAAAKNHLSCPEDEILCIGKKGNWETGHLKRQTLILEPNVQFLAVKANMAIWYFRGNEKGPWEN